MNSFYSKSSKQKHGQNSSRYFYHDHRVFMNMFGISKFLLLINETSSRAKTISLSTYELKCSKKILIDLFRFSQFLAFFQIDFVLQCLLYIYVYVYGVCSTEFKVQRICNAKILLQSIHWHWTFLLLLIF